MDSFAFGPWYVDTGVYECKNSMWMQLYLLYSLIMYVSATLGCIEVTDICTVFSITEIEKEQPFLYSVCASFVYIQLLG